MKDIYKRLGISRESTLEEIQHAINNRTNVDLRNSAEFILLNQKRKRVYDRSHQVLSQIGKLRANLGLNNSPHWIQNDYLDFNKSPDKTESLFTKSFKRDDSVSKTLKSGKEFYKNLPEGLMRKLQARQAGSINDQYKLKIEKLYPKYIWLVIFISWFVLLFNLAKGYKWSGDSSNIYLVFSLIAGILVGWKLDYIFQWHRSKLKSYLYITPIYFIKTQFNKIEWWPIWELKDIKITHNIRNGGYQNTNIELFFNDEHQNFVISPKIAVDNWIQTFNTLEKRLRSHISNKNGMYISENDDFKNLSSSKTKFSKFSVRFLTTIMITILLGLSVHTVAYNINESRPSFIGIPPQNIQSSKGKEDKQFEFNEPKIALPPNGQTQKFTRKKSIAPLRIITSGYDQHYYVKLSDWYSDKPIMIIFIRGGFTIEAEVPLGSYRIKYATGKSWYGNEFLFGPETSYSKADRKFDFEIIENEIQGYTIELFLQQDGNLSTSRIPPDEW